MDNNNTGSNSDENHREVDKKQQKKRSSNDSTTTTHRGLTRNQSVGFYVGSGGGAANNSSSSTTNANSAADLLNIFNYTGILYTQNEKRYIQFKLKDFYSDNNSILLTGKIPGKFFCSCYLSILLISNLLILK